MEFESNKFTINEVPDGPLLLKVIIQLAHIDTRATVTVIRTRLSSLDAKMSQLQDIITEFNEYVKRQNFHRQAELTAVEDLLSLDSDQPVLADSSGSFCELFAAGDPTFSALKDRFLIVSLRESDELVQNLIVRYVENPKPIYYPPDLLSEYWSEYSEMTGDRDRNIDPTMFALWAYQKLISVRRDKFAALAKHGDISISAADLRYA